MMKRKMMKKIIAFSLALNICLLTACSDNTETEVYQQQELHYQTSDEAMEAFLNDFAHRNLRYDELATGKFAVTDGTGFAKNWEAMGITWHNASASALGEDKIAKIYRHLSNIDQDDLGMIYNTHNSFEDAFVESMEAAVPQGWPFPTWYNSSEDQLSFGADYSVGTTVFEFNDTDDWQSDKWVVENGTFAVNEETGYADFASNKLNKGQTFRFYRTDISELERFGGIGSEYAPFVEIAMHFTSRNLDDYYVIWKTKEGGDTWYSVPHNYIATTENTSFDNYSDRTYLEMYLADNWDNQVITAIGLEFRPEEGKELSVTTGQIDFMRCQYDTRQSNATLQWLLALANYVDYTGDVDGLAKLMPKAREALLFLTHVLEGEKGLLDISYLYGHNGIGMYLKEDGTYNFDTTNGVGNGYWDLLVHSEIGLEANIYYYQALKAMANLEQKLVDAGIEVTDTSVIRNRMPGEEKITYQYTADSIASLAEEVKANMEKEIKPVKQEDGTYANEGGFWCSDTGRFAAGINEETGKIADYGYVYWNLELICAGVGTDEQQLSIMEWIDGQRTVEGDNSTEDDIYFYEFAPRFNTKDAQEQFSPFAATNIAPFTEKKLSTWSRSLQNGGAAIAWSYYDLVARAKVLGADNAYERLQEIQAWYEKVSENTEGDGYSFYSGYYDQLAAEAEEKMYMEDDDSEYGIWTVQASPQVGCIGLDAEFIESVILIKAIPDAFFGMQADKYNSITFKHNLPSELDVFQLDNLKYGDCVYSIKETKNSLEVLNAIGTANAEQTITLCFDEPRGSYKVYVDGEKTEDYTVEDGVIYITLPFDEVNVTVK